MTGKTDNDLVRRGLKLGRLGASLTGSYLAYQVQNLMYGSGTAGERRAAFPLPFVGDRVTPRDRPRPPGMGG